MEESEKTLTEEPQTDESEISLAGQFATAWAADLQKILLRLPFESLAEVIRGADQSAVKQVMKTLGLGAKWRSLKRREGRKAAEAIAGTLAIRLVGDVHENDPTLCARLLFTWWARAAKRYFEATPWSQLLVEQPMMLAIGAVAAESRDAGVPAEVVAIQDELQNSDQVLERVTAGLLQCALDSGDDADSDGIGERISEWVGPADQLDEDVLVAYRETARAQALPGNLVTFLLDNHRQGVTIATAIIKQTIDTPDRAGKLIRTVWGKDDVGRKKIPATPPLPRRPIGTGQSPVETDIERVADPRLEFVIRCRQKALKAKSLLSEAMSRGDVEEAQKHLKTSAGLEKEIDVYLTELGVPQKGRIDTVRAVLADDNKKCAHALMRVQDSLQARAKTEREAVAQGVEDLRNDFQRHGLDSPPELALVASLKELDAIRVQYQKSLKKYQSTADFEESLVRTKEFDELNNQMDRFVTYQKVAETFADQPGRPDQLLRHLIDDSKAIFDRGGDKDVAEKFPQFFRTVLVETLKRNQPLPAGVWKTYERGCDPADFLTNEESRLICLKVRDTFRLSELRKTKLLNSQPQTEWPAALRCTVDRISAASAPAAQRVGILAKLALEHPHDPLVLEALFSSLLDTGRFNEAALLDHWKTPRQERSDFEESAQDARRLDAMLFMLIDAAMGHERRRGLVRELISGAPLWLTESATEVAILFFLARQTDAEDVIAQLTYQGADSLQEAKVEHPVLVEEWLEDRVRSHGSDPRQNELAQLQTEWDQWIERKTIAEPNWAPGYQFKKELNERLHKIAKGYDAPESLPTAQRLYAEVQKSLAAKPRDSTRKRMIDSLEQQLHRLDRIRDCQRILGSADAANSSSLSDDALREALKTERERSRSTSPIRMIYDHALEHC